MVERKNKLLLKIKIYTTHSTIHFNQTPRLTMQLCDRMGWGKERDVLILDPILKECKHRYKNNSHTQNSNIQKQFRSHYIYKPYIVHNN